MIAGITASEKAEISTLIEFISAQTTEGDFMTHLRPSENGTLELGGNLTSFEQTSNQKRP